MSEPKVDFRVSDDILEHAMVLCDSDEDQALLHLAVAFAGKCNGIDEAKAIGAYGYRIDYQRDQMVDNVLHFGRKV